MLLAWAAGISISAAAIGGFQGGTGEREARELGLIPSNECSAEVLHPPSTDNPCSNLFNFICGNEGGGRESRRSLRLNDDDRVANSFRRVHATYRAWIGDSSLTGNLSDSERKLLLALLDEVAVAPRSVLGSHPEIHSIVAERCGPSGSTPLLRNLLIPRNLSSMAAFEVLRAPFRRTDGRSSYFPVILCPGLVAKASDEQLDSLIAHEMSHLVGPGGLSRLIEQTDSALASSSSRRGLGGYLQHLSTRLHSSPMALRESLLRIRRQLYPSNENLYAATSQRSCYTIAGLQTEEALADENGASVIGYGLRHGQIPIQGRRASDYVRAAFGHFCRSEFSAEFASRDPHPSGTARLTQVIGNNPLLRAALGCQDRAAILQTSHGRIFHPRWGNLQAESDIGPLEPELTIPRDFNPDEPLTPAR